jgi:formyl-CoA transferase
VGVLAALQKPAFERQGPARRGVAVRESALAATIWETGMYLSTGEGGEANGARHRLAAPYEPLKTADGTSWWA